MKVFVALVVACFVTLAAAAIGNQQQESSNQPQKNLFGFGHLANLMPMNMMSSGSNSNILEPIIQRIEQFISKLVVTLRDQLTRIEQMLKSRHNQIGGQSSNGANGMGSGANGGVTQPTGQNNNFAN